jgi:hypothetical protein
MFYVSVSRAGFVLMSLMCMFFLIGLGCCFFANPLNARIDADYKRSLAATSTEIARTYPLPGDITNVVRNQYSGFEHVSVVLTDLQTTSSRTGLVVLDATSRPIETKEKTLFGQVQISTRMKGNYKDIKNLISKLLATHEGLSLDGLSFRRARAADPLLDAEIRLTFYYKKDA